MAKAGDESRPARRPRRRLTLADRRDADPRAIVTALNEAEVEFVAVGGVAGLALGVQRITRDFDLVIEPSHANCRRAIAALVGLGAEEFHPETKRWVRIHRNASPEWLLRQARFFDSDAGAIDICNTIPGVPDWQTAHGGSVEITVFGQPLRVLDKDTFIRSKLVAGREKDLADVTEINELDEAERQE